MNTYTRTVSSVKSGDIFEISQPINVDGTDYTTIKLGNVNAPKESDPRFDGAKLKLAFFIDEYEVAIKDVEEDKENNYLVAQVKKTISDTLINLKMHEFIAKQEKPKKMSAEAF